MKITTLFAAILLLFFEPVNAQKITVPSNYGEWYYPDSRPFPAKPDSLVNVSITAKNLTEFAQNLQGERYGAAYNYNRSIFENSPAITGYTSLIGQILGLSAAGTQAQKNGAQYVITKYGAYSNNLTNMINQYYQQGIYWIQH